MVNISDVNATTQTDKGSWSDKKNLQICDPMNDYIDTFEDSEYVECFGMEMAKRPNCIGIGNAKVTDETNRKEEYVIEKMLVERIFKVLPSKIIYNDICFEEFIMEQREYEAYIPIDTSKISWKKFKEFLKKNDLTKIENKFTKDINVKLSLLH